MIDVILFYGSEVVFVRIRNSTVNFATSSSQGKYSDISGLRISRAGAIKLYPDLYDKVDWKSQAISRFKEHIQSLGSEEEIFSYVIRELKDCGYVPKYKQKQGFRRELIK